jgi:hypothetical protein
MRRASLCVLALLVGSTALVPISASAASGLQVFLFVSPQGRSVDQTVDVNLEAYFEGALVDLDTIDIAPGFAASPLTFDNISTGKYHTTYTINASDLFFGGLNFYGTADFTTLSSTIISSYTVGGGSSGWTLSVRQVVSGSLGLIVGPGTVVTVEARSYHNGALAEGGPINISTRSSEGFSSTYTDANLTSTKTADGVYTATFTVPADLSNSRSYQVKADLGTGPSAPSVDTFVQANPLPVAAAVSDSTTTSATVNVWAGSAAPIAGANVSLTGMAISLGYPPSITTVGPFYADTSASGKATLHPTFPATTTGSWFLNVSSGGKMTTTYLALSSTGPIGWIPMPAIGYGCEVRLQSDPTNLKASQTANLKFKMTDSGTTVASATVARFVWRDGDGGTFAGGNTTTDASGNFSVSYPIPSNWTQWDTLKVEAVCPSGSSGSADVQTGSASAFGPGAVTVSATGKLGAAVAITATYTGTQAFTNAQAFAVIVPGRADSISAVGSGGTSLTTPLTRAGSTYTGSITVPEWLGEGDYSVAVIITNQGATSSTSDQSVDGNYTTIHLSSVASSSSGGTPAKGFLPGFDGVAALAAAGAVGLVLAAGRRRRAA